MLRVTTILLVLGLTAAASAAGEKAPGTRSPQFRQMKRHIESQTLPVAEKQQAIEAARRLVARTRARQRSLSSTWTPDGTILSLVGKTRAGSETVMSGLDAVSHQDPNGPTMILRVPLGVEMARAAAGRELSAAEAEAAEWYLVQKPGQLAIRLGQRGLLPVSASRFERLVGHRFEPLPFYVHLAPALAADP